MSARGRQARRPALRRPSALRQAVKDKQLVLHKINGALQRHMVQAQRAQAQAAG